MQTNDFDYELPKELIAHDPLEKRDASRMLVYNKPKDKVELKHFYDIVDFLNKGDVVVINTTKVMNAKMFGLCKKGRKFELLLHKPVNDDSFEILLKPAKKLGVGETIEISDTSGTTVVGTLKSKDPKSGTAVMSFDGDPQKVGEMPIPGYINKKPKDPNRYNTVYADQTGSAAAPTAGLHWTPELMDKAKKKGVVFAEVLLHVGIGTFRPVKVENIYDHQMHSEWYNVTKESADIINKAKKAGNKIVATGTTSVRTLEAVYKRYGEMRECNGDTDIFIYPGFEFGMVDVMITNFHLPKSTLVMLVSAFIGREKTLELYNLAVKERFRFFSFGDACFFVRA